MIERTIASPTELDLNTPGRRDYWVRLEHDSIWAEWHIPVTVFVGRDAKPGEGVVAFGANHGNEYEGPVALKHLMQEIDLADVTGRIILIPVLNPSAFRTGTRCSDDDDRVNLNRAFVEGAGRVPGLGGITHRIARFVRDAIWPHVNVAIDLHAAGDVIRFAPCVSFHEIEDANQARVIEETAAWFGTPFLFVYQNQTPGLLPSEAERLGKVAIGGEFGWGSAVSHDGVRFAQHGVRAACIRHGQIRGKIEPIAHHADGSQRKVIAVRRECYVAAPWPGHYESLIDCGEKVSAGQTVGLLHDFNRIDEEPWPVRAQVDGYVLCQAWHARVPAGLHVLVVAEEK